MHLELLFRRPSPGASQALIFSVFWCVCSLQKGDVEAVPGYLSLHQSAGSLTLKWTPNQLMNGTLGDSELEKRWGLWDFLQGASLPGGGWRDPACSGGRPHSLSDAKNCRGRQPGQVPELSRTEPGLGTERFA